MLASHTNTSRVVAALLITSMLTACAESGRPGSGVLHGGSLNKEDIGTAAGAVAGGVVGYQFGAGAGQALATVGGVLLGGMLGNAVGRSLDNADRAAYDEASQRAMESGARQSWRNPDTGHYGYVVPSRQYTNSDGQFCREYSQSIFVDGKRHRGHGTACREDDGTWRIV